MNAYHNLAGWLRDVRSVLGDRTELADSYYWQLRDLVEEVLELVGDDEPDAEELESEDADTDVADIGQGDGSEPRSDGRRARPRSAAAVGGSPGMGDVLPRVRGEQSSQRTAGDAARVAGTGTYVRERRNGWIATGVVEKPLELNKPTTASSRGGSSTRKSRTQRGSSKKAGRRAKK